MEPFLCTCALCGKMLNIFRNHIDDAVFDAELNHGWQRRGEAMLCDDCKEEY